jgi:hypothetical protein
VSSVTECGPQLPNPRPAGLLPPRRRELRAGKIQGRNQGPAHGGVGWGVGLGGGVEVGAVVVGLASQQRLAAPSRPPPPLSPPAPPRAQAARRAPRDPDLRRKLTECEKAVKRIRFEEALATPVGWLEGGSGVAGVKSQRLHPGHPGQDGSRRRLGCCMSIASAAAGAEPAPGLPPPPPRRSPRSRMSATPSTLARWWSRTPTRGRAWTVRRAGRAVPGSWTARRTAGHGSERRAGWHPAAPAAALQV